MLKPMGQTFHNTCAYDRTCSSAPKICSSQPELRGLRSCSKGPRVDSQPVLYVLAVEARRDSASDDLSASPATGESWGAILLGTDVVPAARSHYDQKGLQSLYTLVYCPRGLGWRAR